MASLVDGMARGRHDFCHVSVARHPYGHQGHGPIPTTPLPLGNGGAWRWARRAAGEDRERADPPMPKASDRRAGESESPATGEPESLRLVRAKRFN